MDHYVEVGYGVQQCTSYLFPVRVKIALAVAFEFWPAILHFGF